MATPVVAAATATVIVTVAEAAVAMEEAAAYYRHRCLDLGLDKLQWWLEEEAAEWAEEETRHMRADYIWECSREARFGAERRVWQQWKAVTAIWGEREEKKAAALEAAAVDWTRLESDEEAQQQQKQQR